ncbi:MAG: hypothetical protein ACFFB0_22435 [Promethearchaeota archaeon]
MVKKFVGFILLGIAAINFVTAITLFFTYRNLLGPIGVPDSLRKTLIGTILIGGLIPAIVLLIAGIIVLIKASKQNKQLTLMDQKNQS